MTDARECFFRTGVVASSRHRIGLCCRIVVGGPCALSRASAPGGKAISKQTYFFLHKIKEVDEFLRARPELHEVVREVHPEVCFCELAGRPMVYSKKRQPGRKERVQALRLPFSDIDVIVNDGEEGGSASRRYPGRHGRVLVGAPPCRG